MSGQPRLVAIRIDMPSNRAHRENGTRPRPNTERLLRRVRQVSMRKKHLSRDFESPHFAQAKSGIFSSRIHAFPARSVGYHTMLCDRSGTGTLGDYAQVKPWAEEEEPIWRNVHHKYYAPHQSYRSRNRWLNFFPSKNPLRWVRVSPRKALLPRAVMMMPYIDPLRLIFMAPKSGRFIIWTRIPSAWTRRAPRDQALRTYVLQSRGQKAAWAAPERTRRCRSSKGPCPEEVRGGEQSVH